MITVLFVIRDGKFVIRGVKTGTQPAIMISLMISKPDGFYGIHDGQLKIELSRCAEMAPRSSRPRGLGDRFQSTVVVTWRGSWQPPGFAVRLRLRPACPLHSIPRGGEWPTASAGQRATASKPRPAPGLPQSCQSIVGCDVSGEFSMLIIIAIIISRAVRISRWR